MRATCSALATLLVSTVTFSAASAQTPYPAYPVMPTAYGCADGSCGGTAAPVAGITTSGGCEGCGKPSLLAKLGIHPRGCGGCNTCGHGCGLCAAFKGWLCRPLPTDAPICRRSEYPLGFPNHPYARSPRDYFMFDDP